MVVPNSCNARIFKTLMDTIGDIRPLRAVLIMPELSDTNPGNIKNEARLLVLGREPDYPVFQRPVRLSAMNTVKAVANLPEETML